MRWATRSTASSAGSSPRASPIGNGTHFFQDLGLSPSAAPGGLAPAGPESDSGIQGDSNTDVRTPSFVGQVDLLIPGLAGRGDGLCPVQRDLPRGCRPGDFDLGGRARRPGRHRSVRRPGRDRCQWPVRDQLPGAARPASPRVRTRFGWSSSVRPTSRRARASRPAGRGLPGRQYTAVCRDHQ